MRLFLVALVACGGAVEAPPPPPFTLTDASAWDEACAYWNVRTYPGKLARCALPYCDVAGKRWRVTKHPRVYPWTGSTDPGGATMDVAEGLDPSTYLWTAEHEMGHALDLMHTASGVMAEEIRDNAFTADVMAECRRVRSCP